jgi:predicted nucleic acid-binding protein
MTDLVFVDTNILVYLRDDKALSKQQMASLWMERLVRLSAACLNLQVLNEYASVMFKRQPDRPPDDVRREIDVFGTWGRRALQPEDVRVAWMVREALGFQWFDCLLLASASNDGCNVFLSEDMIDGARFGDLLIVNPFKHHPDEFLPAD